MAKLTLRGQECSCIGELPEIGSKAPEFSLVNERLQDIGLDHWKDKKKILNIVPSLDTKVCAKSTKIFNQKLNEQNNVVLLIISADLPFAQSRFCSTEKLDRVISLSMMRSRKFAKDYGVLIENGPLAGLTARAVLVLNEDNKVIYNQLVSEISEEPDYDAAIAAL